MRNTGIADLFVWDVLHRQINIVHGKRLLFRKMEQTRREGSRHGLASHGTRSAPSTGSRRESALLPVQGPVRNGQRVEDFYAPPAQRWAPAARPARCIVGCCARWRSNRRGCLRWFVLENVSGLFKRYRGQVSFGEQIMSFLDENLPAGWAFARKAL